MGCSLFLVQSKVTPLLCAHSLAPFYPSVVAQCKPTLSADAKQWLQEYESWPAPCQFCWGARKQ